MPRRIKPVTHYAATAPIMTPTYCRPMLDGDRTQTTQDRELVTCQACRAKIARLVTARAEEESIR